MGSTYFPMCRVSYGADEALKCTSAAAADTMRFLYQNPHWKPFGRNGRSTHRRPTRQMQQTRNTAPLICRVRYEAIYHHANQVTHCGSAFSCPVPTIDMRIEHVPCGMCRIRQQPVCLAIRTDRDSDTWYTPHACSRWSPDGRISDGVVRAFEEQDTEQTGHAQRRACERQHHRTSGFTRRLTALVILDVRPPPIQRREHGQRRPFCHSTGLE